AAIRDAVDLARARAAVTCEECGAEGRLYWRYGLYLGLCGTHSGGEPVIMEPQRLRLVTRRGDQVILIRSYDREHDRFVDQLVSSMGIADLPRVGYGATIKAQ